MVRLGQKVKFSPLAAAPAAIEIKFFQGLKTEGTVVGISEHGWLLVEYDAHGTKLRTTFRFDDIEEGRVRICGK